MKSIILISLGLFISLQAYCQDSSISLLSFTEVVKVDTSLSSNILYQRAREWFAETYNSAQNVIQMDDKEQGKIIGKGNIQYQSSILKMSDGSRGWIRYTISLQVKDGRYKYEITDFYHEGNPLNSGGQASFGLITNQVDCPYKVIPMMGKPWKNKVWKDIKKVILADMNLLTESLKNALSKPSKNKDSDW